MGLETLCAVLASAAIATHLLLHALYIRTTGTFSQQSVYNNFTDIIAASYMHMNCIWWQHF